jgi:hypothetical protein
MAPSTPANITAAITAAAVAGSGTGTGGGETETAAREDIENWVIG